MTTRPSIGRAGRRSQIRLVAAVLFVLLAAGCRRTEPELAAPPVPEATRRFAGVTLTYHGDSPGPAPALERALLERFTADTGIRVAFRPRPASASETYLVYERLFRARRSDVDVLLIDVIWTGAFASELVDLAPALGREAARHLPMSIRNNTVEGRLVAMPCFLDMGLLYYRSDLLRRHGFSGPPATWEDLERMARTIQEAERKANPGFWGYVWQGAPHEALTCDALEWQVSHGGGRLLSPQGRVEVDNPRAIAAFRRAAGWVGTISPLGVTGHQESDAAELFSSGAAAFMRNWSYLYAKCNASTSPVRGRFAVATLPHAAGPYRSASVLGGWQLGVSRFSRHPAAAIELVRYLASPEVQAWRATHASYVPTIPSVLALPEVQAAQPYLKATAARLSDLVARPSAQLKGRYDAVSTTYYEGVEGILEGEDAASSAAHMQRDIERLLAWPESSLRTPGAGGG